MRPKSPSPISRRSLLRSALAVGGAAALGSGLAGCGSSGGSGSGSSSKELNLWHWEEGAQEPLNRVIQEFQSANPGLTIKPRFMPYASYNTTLQAALAAKSEPDIFFPGVALTALGKAGRTLDLKKELGDSFTSQFFDSVNQQATYNGGQYGVAFNAQIFLLYYNKKILAKAGVEPPETWDDVIRIAPIIRQKTGELPVALYGNPNNALADFYLPLVTQAGDDPAEMYKLDAHDNGTTWNTPHAVEAFQKVVDLVNAKVFDPGILSVDQDGSYAAYTGGKAAMMFTGSFFLPTLYSTASKDFIANEFAYTKTPAWKTGARHWAGDQSGSVFSVSARTGNKTAALDFLRFMYDPGRYSTLMNDASSMPATKLATQQVKDENVKKMAGWLADGDGAPHILFGQGSFTAVANATAGVFQGKYNPQQAVAAVETAVVQARR
jgi:raffinose/stachyose/melibiose transport system substrate-binding protein